MLLSFALSLVLVRLCPTCLPFPCLSFLSFPSFLFPLQARTIDKRKQTSLRAAADDAWDNLMGFLKYRDSLRARGQA